MRTLSAAAAVGAGLLLLGTLPATTARAATGRSGPCEHQVDGSRRQVEGWCGVEFDYRYYRIAVSCADGPDSSDRSLVLGPQTPVGAASLVDCPAEEVVTGEWVDGVWRDHVGFKGVR